MSALEGGEAAPSGPDRLLADAAQVARQADARLTAALHDLFLPDFVRPTDSQRAAMAQMLDGLVQELERDVRLALASRLGPDAPPVLEVERIPILRPIFDRAGVLRDRDLIGLLLTRSEECRIGQTIRRVAELRPAEGAAVRLDAPVELEASLLAAEARRFGDMGAPRFALADLPADLLHRLLWRAAAALRDYLERSSALSGPLRDDALAAVVGERLAAHDEGRSLAALAMRLALAVRGDDLLLLELFQAGRFSLFVAMLAVRARLDFGPAFLLAADPSLGALAVLLRAVETPTQVAAPILLQMAAVNGLGDMKLEERVNDFLDLDVAAAREAIRPWQLDRAFREAIVDIGRERRSR
ncbi:DUF2336 domain-containing protein [Sphingomonas sp. ID1715]|nr:DUF2336 domain-containing protein [Sphingomonas sp. ID1715]